MQNTSPAYKTEQKAMLRGALTPRIRLGVIDEDAAQTATVTASATAPFASVAQTVYTSSGATTAYATAEPSRMKLDGRQRILPRLGGYAHEGYVSDEISDGNGFFEAPPTITFTFSKTHSVPALTLAFGTIEEDFPLSATIKVFCEGALTEQHVIQPQALVHVLEHEIKSFDKLEILFVKALPYRRARLRQIIFGIGLVFDAQLLSGVTQGFDFDPICRRLPQSTLRFGVKNTNTLTANYDGLFNIDAPIGAYAYTQKHSPVTLEWEQAITSGVTWSDTITQDWAQIERSSWDELYSGGYTQGINGGKYYLTSKPSISGDIAQFEATDILALAKGTYYKGVFDGNAHDLYSLAQEVLQDAALPPIANDVPWRIWSGLRHIYTSAPLPLDEHRNVLKLIAHAARCVLYCDRDGYVRIEPLGEEQHEDYHSLSQIVSPLRATDTGELQAVQCAHYSYQLAGVQSEIVRQSVQINGVREVMLEHAASVVSSAVISGGELVKRESFASRTRLTIAAQGDCEIVLLGQEIKAVKGLIAAQSSSDGEIEELDNPLITSEQAAQDVAAWARDWLCRRITYSYDTIGDAEMDALDLIYMQSYFNEKFSVRLLKTVTTAQNGAVKTQITAKKM